MYSTNNMINNMQGIFIDINISNINAKFIAYCFDADGKYIVPYGIKFKMSISHIFSLMFFELLIGSFYGLPPTISLGDDLTLIRCCRRY